MWRGKGGVIGGVGGGGVKGMWRGVEGRGGAKPFQNNVEFETI